jgi:hypothetical protein
MEISREAPQKSKNRTTCDLAILLLDIHPKESDSAYKREIHTPVFIVPLFKIAKLWNYPVCL